MLPRLIKPAIVVAAAAALGACSTYGGYGRTYASVGYGSGGYYPYSSRYSPYDYYGWYGDYYYPGTGYYVFDRRGNRHRWSDRQRRYWEARRGNHRNARENWSGYRREDRRQANRDWRRGDRRANRQDYRRDDRRADRRDNRRNERYVESHNRNGGDKRGAYAPRRGDNARSDRRSQRSERAENRRDRDRRDRRRRD